jgi:hypothetical protein
MMARKQFKITPGLFAFLVFGVIIDFDQLNSPMRHSYPERWRDRPDETSATREFKSHGANSGRAIFWKMRGKPSLIDAPLAPAWRGAIIL